MAGQALVARASPRPSRTCAHEEGDVRVAVVDYGCKRSILRRLAAAGAAVTVYPHDVDADELASYDGVVLSNGPGDPEPLRDEIGGVRDLLGRVPVLGICLGHQLLGARDGPRDVQAAVRPSRREPPRARPACGSRPRHDARTTGSRCARPRTAQATHVSLYDGTVEGLDYPELRARSLQFHPEAGPGPHDARPLIETWVEEVRAAA